MRRYLNKGGDTSLPPEAVSFEPAVINANQQALSQLASSVEKARLSIGINNVWNNEDLRTSLGRIAITYVKETASVISAQVRDNYTFQPNTPEELASPGLNAPLPYFSRFAKQCCFKKGYERDDVRDLWMASLEDYGYAKSFWVSIKWELFGYSSGN